MELPVELLVRPSPANHDLLGVFIQVIIFSKSYCPFCHKAKRALGGVLDMSKVTVIEVTTWQA